MFVKLEEDQGGGGQFNKEALEKYAEKEISDGNNRDRRAQVQNQDN